MDINDTTGTGGSKSSVRNSNRKSTPKIVDTLTPALETAMELATTRQRLDSLEAALLEAKTKVDILETRAVADANTLRKLGRTTSDIRFEITDIRATAYQLRRRLNRWPQAALIVSAALLAVIAVLIRFN